MVIYGVLALTLMAMNALSFYLGYRAHRELVVALTADAIEESARRLQEMRK